MKEIIDSIRQSKLLMVCILLVIVTFASCVSIETITKSNERVEIHKINVENGIND
mgnify:CR=1 FL=1